MQQLLKTVLLLAGNINNSIPFNTFLQRKRHKTQAWEKDPQTLDNKTFLTERCIS